MEIPAKIISRLSGVASEGTRTVFVLLLVPNSVPKETEALDARNKYYAKHYLTVFFVTRENPALTVLLTSSPGPTSPSGV